MGFLLCILGRKRRSVFFIFFHLHRDVSAASNLPGSTCFAAILPQKGCG